MKNIGTLCALIISDIILLIFFFMIIKKKNGSKQLRNSFKFLIVLFIIWLTPLIFQIIYQDTNIDPFFFEQLTGPGLAFMPVAFFYMVNVFTKTKVKLSPIHLVYLIIPTIALALLVTNHKYHLLVISYSTNVAEITYTNYYRIFLVYTYLLVIVGVIKLIIYSLRNSGFFSKQSLLITLGISIPLVINILGTSNIINLTTYTTPISFSFMVLFFSLAILKFDFLGATPIALQRIVDRISDSYIILDENYNITDFNKTFKDTFSLKGDEIRNKNLFDLTKKHNEFKIDSEIFQINFKKIENSRETVVFEQTFTEIQKSFTIEINNIFANKNFLGILILFKDITQHKKDIQTIQDKQDILVEQERLASLGQMIGGIAHNLKTPIFSVAGGLEGLSDLVNEYDASIGNPQVTEQDFHDIAKDMREWIEKLKGHISYMSDVITTVKGQTVTLSDNVSIDFSIAELFKRVDILMKHEINNALATLEIQNNIGTKDILNGNINSLVQIINNIISNAIEAYGKNYTNKKIELTANLVGQNVIISIKDYGPGISKKVQEKLFKEMITTKGKNGTGLGMFMSYSNIRAHFNGSLRYDTELGKGTTFYITLPITVEEDPS